MFARSVIPEVKAAMVGAQNVRCPGQHTLGRASTPSNIPKRPTQDSCMTLESACRESPDVTTRNQCQRTMKEPGDAAENKTRPMPIPRPTTRSVRFEAGLPRRPHTEEEGAEVRDLSSERCQVARRRWKSPAPKFRRRGIPSNAAHVKSEEDTGSWDTSTISGSDGGSSDVIMERHPLEDYPKAGDFPFAKRTINPPPCAGPSALTAGLSDCAAQLGGSDGDLLWGIQLTLDRQAAQSRQQMRELRRLELMAGRTRIPVYRREGVPAWGFRLSENGSAAGSTITEPWEPWKEDSTL
ncbi:hypothetical protein ANO14919_007110 [Xylariales sp. No.14919]|nr:hypothetical protein ANO14919_007110 [Xylariales sp. No.14919]